MQPTGTPGRLSGHMKLLLAALFAIGLASVPAGAGRRLQLRAVDALKQAAEFADAVFAGTVVNSQPIGAKTGPVGAMAAADPAPALMGQTIYTFEVDGVAKGPVGATVDVLAGGDGASCGMSFGLNERWLVFTTWDGAMHSTGLCSGNLTLEKGAEAPFPLTAPTGGRPEPGACGDSERDPRPDRRRRRPGRGLVAGLPPRVDGVA